MSVDHQGHQDHQENQEEMVKMDKKVIREILDEWANADQLENLVQLVYQALMALM